MKEIIDSKTGAILFKREKTPVDERIEILEKKYELLEEKYDKLLKEVALLKRS